MVLGAVQRCRPTVIKFEHLLLFGGMTPAQFGEVTELLTAAEYRVLTGPSDAVAYTA